MCTTPLYGLWSRRSRVRIPSLTLEVAVIGWFMVRCSVDLRGCHGPICDAERLTGAWSARRVATNRGLYPRDLDGLGYHLGGRDGSYAELLRASAPAIEYGSGN